MVAQAAPRRLATLMPLAAMPPPAATVVVCTRNRSRALESACRAVLGLPAPFGWELLLVDNASTDDTLEVARELAAGDRRVRVAVEPVLGLSAARNLGVRLARGGLVVFLDDDARPQPGWFDAWETVFADPAVAAAGGPVDPDWAGALPEWVGPEFLPYLSVWDRGPEAHDLVYNELPRGANMAFRREVFGRYGDFDHRLGRRGRSLRSCEEIELCLRLERGGERIRYAPGARVRHRVETGRLTPAWMLARFAAQGFSEAIVDWKHGGPRALVAGNRRLAAATAHHAGRAGEGSLFVACHAAAHRAYRRGGLYAAVAVARWAPRGQNLSASR